MVTTVTATDLQARVADGGRGRPRAGLGRHRHRTRKAPQRECRSAQLPATTQTAANVSGPKATGRRQRPHTPRPAHPNCPRHMSTAVRRGRCCRAACGSSIPGRFTSIKRPRSIPRPTAAQQPGRSPPSLRQQPRLIIDDENTGSPSSNSWTETPEATIAGQPTVRKVTLRVVFAATLCTGGCAACSSTRISIWSLSLRTPTH